MSYLATIIGAALVVYSLRLSGFLLADVPLPGYVRQAFGNLPVAIFAALFVLALPGQAGEGDIRLVAACIAAVALWFTRRLWVGLLVGMCIFWLLRILM